VKCFHWCRNVNGDPGHDWFHECKGDEQLDSFRLFCPAHGSEVATQILSGNHNAVESPERKEIGSDGREAYSGITSRFIFTERGQSESFEVACFTHDAESE
jgi:hypothetical protein